MQCCTHVVTVTVTLQCSKGHLSLPSLYATFSPLLFLSKDPEVFDTVRDMQFHHVKKEPMGDLHSICHGAASLKDPKRKAGKVQRKPTFSSYLADDNIGDDQSAQHRTASSFMLVRKEVELRLLVQKG